MTEEAKCDRLNRGKSKWVRFNGARADATPGDTKKDRKPAKASGPHRVEVQVKVLLGGEIAARETDEAEDTGAEERQRERLWNSGRCVD